MEWNRADHHVKVDIYLTPHFLIHLTCKFREAYCDMKIQEKGLKGKAAENRKDAMNSRGFNAFRLMGLGSKDGKDASSSSDANKEILLDFLGHKIRLFKDESGNGIVKEEDVPFVRGATLRFDGCGGSVSWSDIKVT